MNADGLLLCLCSYRGKSVRWRRASPKFYKHDAVSPIP